MGETRRKTKRVVLEREIERGKTERKTRKDTWEKERLGGRGG